MARISELHYSNAYARNSGIEEFLEVALGPGEDPADFVVSFYQSTGFVGVEIPLTAAGVTQTTDPQNGEEVFVISADNFNILLTDPNGNQSNNYEAYALVNTATNTVVDFYDIGGGTQNIFARNGLAAGATSENVPVLVGPNQTTTTLQWNQPNPDTLTYDTIGAGDTGLACFTKGTLIETPSGLREIDGLTVGDLVLTRDNGPRPIKWIGMRTVAGRGVFAPIEFSKGAHGAFAPLLVSPQHRMLVSGWQVELMFAESEVFVPAQRLVNGTSIRRKPMPSVTYVHVLFDQHEVLTCNGVQSESMFLAEHAISAWEEEERDEIFTLFPELRGNAAPWALARAVPKGQLGSLFT